MDKLLAKLPGSHGSKVFLAVSSLIAITAYPVFGRATEGSGTQGAAYLSQERPEAISRAEDKHRKKKLREKQAERERQKQQAEHQ